VGGTPGIGSPRKSERRPFVVVSGTRRNMNDETVITTTNPSSSSGTKIGRSVRPALAKRRQRLYNITYPVGSVKSGTEFRKRKNEKTSGERYPLREYLRASRSIPTRTKSTDTRDPGGITVVGNPTSGMGGLDRRVRFRFAEIRRPRLGREICRGDLPGGGERSSL